MLGLTLTGADLYYELNGYIPPTIFSTPQSTHQVLSLDNRGAGQTAKAAGASVTIQQCSQ